MHENSRLRGPHLVGKGVVDPHVGNTPEFFQ